MDRCSSYSSGMGRIVTDAVVRVHGEDHRMQFKDHPTVRDLAKRAPDASGRHSGVQDAALLRRIAVDHGADDVGIVEIERPALQPQRAEILRNYPWTKSLLSFVVRMAREPIRG